MIKVISLFCDDNGHEYIVSVLFIFSTSFSNKMFKIICMYIVLYFVNSFKINRIHQYIIIVAFVIHKSTVVFFKENYLFLLPKWFTVKISYQINVIWISHNHSRKKLGGFSVTHCQIPRRRENLYKKVIVDSHPLTFKYCVYVCNKGQ